MEHSAVDAAQELEHELRQAVGDVRFDHLTRLLYSTDASLYQVMPVGVVFPRDADDVSAVVEIAARRRVPVLPRGGGSSLAGQAVNHALVLDFSRYMDSIVRLDPEQRLVQVQPGVTIQAVNQVAAQHGLLFGPDPASAERATVGGTLGNNATGAHSIRYGMSADHIASIEAVLSDGTRAGFSSFAADGWVDHARRPGLQGAIYHAIRSILQEHAEAIARRYPRTWRHVAGYNLQRLLNAQQPNLAELLVGSEGTLAITTSATLRLVQRPPLRRLALVHFSELQAALEAVPALLEVGPAAIELTDRAFLDLTRDRLEYRQMRSFIEGDPAAVQVVELDGASEGELDAAAARLHAVLARTGHHDPVVILSDPVRQAAVWHTRKAALGIVMSMPGAAKPIPFIEDAAVPVEHLAAYVDGVQRLVSAAGVERLFIYAHASAGCLHIRPMINLKTPDGMRQLREIAEGALELQMAYGGTTSGEHGEGIARGEFSGRLFGPELSRAFRAVKAAFDPHNLLNPGRVVDAPRMDDASLMRISPAYTLPLQPHRTVFEYAPHAGFAAAVEMCNGAGVCRKLSGGVMCPSFMVTREEAHSTRGRANALRAAMQGRLGPDGMSSHELYEVLDLCLSCKACKSECPSSVDMARLKADFLYAYHQEHGTPLRARFFGHIADLYRLGQPVAPLTNALLGGPGRLLARWLGIDPRRELPRLTSRPFSAWYRRHSRAVTQGTGRPPVVLFHDTFMEHTDPAVGVAAVAVLEAAGYNVIIPHHRACCGRPLISKGLLGAARRAARHNVDLLLPYALEGVPVVGCEPSCVAMLVDEYPALLPGEAARTVAAQARLIEDLLVEALREGRFRFPAEAPQRRVLLHGHCHAKALFGVVGAQALLESIPGCSVELVDSGCCGMAGSFGYESEHYDLSIALAELSLAPAVRAAGPEAIIAAHGTSCREQIVGITGRQALHPVQVLADALLDAPLT